MRIISRAVFGVLFTLLLSAVSASAQTAFDVSKDFRANLKTLMDAKDYKAALDLYGQLESSKYSLGDAAAQSAAAAKQNSVMTDKGRLLISMGRFSDADAVYYKAFDGNVAKAESEMQQMADYKAKDQTRSINVTLAHASEVSAKGALSLADSVRALRDAHYTLAKASGAAAPFDPARLNKFKTLQQKLPSN